MWYGKWKLFCHYCYNIATTTTWHHQSSQSSSSSSQDKYVNCKKMGTGYMDAMRLLPCLKLVISHISNWNVNYQPKCKLVFFSSWDCIISYNKQSKGEESDILVEDKIFFTGLVYWATATATGNAVGRSTGHDYNNALRPYCLGRSC